MAKPEIQAWNEAHPVGTPVLVWPGARDEAPEHSYVQHPAAINFGRAQVSVKGWGRIELTHVERATGDAAEHARLYREDSVRRLVRFSVSESDLQTARLLASEAVLNEMSFLHGLSEEAFEADARQLISSAMHRHIASWAERHAGLDYSLTWASPKPAWTRPVGLDHRHRFKRLMNPLSLAKLCEELALWLHRRPENQPYKPEIVLVEKADTVHGMPDGLLWVTVAVNDAHEAFGLGYNLGVLEEKGGLANG